ncbi:MAG: hypothetical protein AB1644_10875 [Candidatus Zixiibacteriota bacterium]
MQEKHIKRCGNCGVWLTASDFVNNPDLVPIGMMFIEDDTTTAYYMFQHETPNCRSSLAVPANEFREFIVEPVPDQVLTLSECCKEHCVKLNDLSNCKQPCYFAPFRRFLFQMIEKKGRAAVPDIGIKSW